MPERDATSEPPRIVALDGLRGIAILLVLGFHLVEYLPTDRAWRYVHAAAAPMWVGVDLFFVLSGFLITGVLLDSIGRADYYRRFYVRRSLRIFPLYFAVLAALAILRAVWPSTSIPFVLRGGSLVPAATYVTNISLSLPDGFARIPLATFHFWSLAIEEQFYLIWPLLVAVIPRRSLARACVLVAVACLIVRLALGAQGVTGLALYSLTVTRLDGFAVGGLLAVLTRDAASAAVVRRLAVPIALTGVLGSAILMGLGGADPLADEPGQWVYTSFLFFTLAIAFAGIMGWALTDSIRASSLLSRRSLRFFGTYSYGLYVFHPIVGALAIVLLDALFPRVGELPAAGLLRAGAALVASMLAALVSWRVIERPALALKDSLTDTARSRAPHAQRPRERESQA